MQDAPPLQLYPASDKFLVKSKESCKVPVKFQKDWPKTVGGVADTRHILPIHICSIKA